MLITMALSPAAGGYECCKGSAVHDPGDVGKTGIHGSIGPHFHHTGPPPLRAQHHQEPKVGGGEDALCYHYYL